MRNTILLRDLWIVSSRINSGIFERILKSKRTYSYIKILFSYD